MSRAALTAAMEPRLPIVCGLVFLESMWPAGWERLIQRIKATLPSEAGLVLNEASDATCL
jgi:hypothetical protein